jgi:hypothetical protein
MNCTPPEADDFRERDGEKIDKYRAKAKVKIK